MAQQPQAAQEWATLDESDLLDGFDTGELAALAVAAADDEIDHDAGPEEAGREARQEGGRGEEAACAEEERRRKKAEEEEEKRRLIVEARAAVDEDEDDTPEEKAEREEARSILAEYHGDAFAATRQDKPDMLRAFLLVNGSEKTLAMRCTAPNEGSRTLLHTAAFWGSMRCLKLLLGLGANPNEIDTVCGRATPLLEAARAGHLNICKTLLEEGADIRAQDAAGDTVFHWCARRGHGSMIRHLLRFGARAAPGSTDNVLLVRNVRGRTARDIATNESVAHLIDRELEKASQSMASPAARRRGRKAGALRA